ncbi:MAG: addiction module protein [Pirellulaceae bacterium]
MSASTTVSIFDAALSLPPQQREELLVLLLRSLEPSDQLAGDNTLTEIHHRIAAIENGESTTIPAETIFAKHGITDPL